MSQSKNLPVYNLAQSSFTKEDTKSTKLRWLNQDISTLEDTFSDAPDLICLSHLRWDFVYQRPQHLLTRCAQDRRVFFIEEPFFGPDEQAWLAMSRRDSGLWVAVPHLPEGLSQEAAIALQKQLLDDLFITCSIRDYAFWYYTPMALAFTDHLQPLAIVYDCMDELSAFQGAPPALKQREIELFQKADLVFTGGQSLYEVKRHQHPNVYAFPSSIDAPHFAQARQPIAEPPDQVNIPHPRLGFYGVIDERMDIDLLAGVADARPDWHLVLIGPVVKIDPATLPQRSNIHYLGGKSYLELPDYLAGWDVALLPFARNESTRFISPTKTPEYLAAGKPVVSTSIRDVVCPYRELGLVQIADAPSEFVAAVETALQTARQDSEWLDRVDAFLAQNSWDKTWASMSHLIESAVSTVKTPTRSPSDP
ncbi:glycosyltransferase family 1 protein [Phormidesmis priestleyi ULC007]|uniref:Glycosyltransferase family 1 protein n=1 Tax=Phormidesmis priestleyi ULC007 TaxID=1920490 RepID=A0A2T1DAH2_9CYAN|nr:glycosyltransferase family 1 protein [Phormidesmis priestleyi]PSB17444.1 glycosyltransferase family 1 protein [Phormidesmis priestleyi ULC007]PZO48395.1 MAG: glycosyltransferase family 1 protein [Phormidesmis priestleyi]